MEQGWWWRWQELWQGGHGGEEGRSEGGRGGDRGGRYGGGVKEVCQRWCCAGRGHRDGGEIHWVWANECARIFCQYICLCYFMIDNCNNAVNLLFLKFHPSG